MLTVIYGSDAHEADRVADILHTVFGESGRPTMRIDYGPGNVASLKDLEGGNFDEVIIVFPGQPTYAIHGDLARAHPIRRKIQCL